jgi:hypothetical protein
VFWGNEELDASGDAGFAPDQSGPVEVENHLMDGGRADTKVTLDVGFGGGLSEYTRINADEGQILALLFGEALRGAAACAV